MSDYGQEVGDPACWLDRICAECGRVLQDANVAVCPNCGTALHAESAETTAGETAGEAGSSNRTGSRAKARRDRDEEGRARNARPRDGLGRPLPHGATGVERQPEGVERTPEQALTEAQQLLDSGMPFHAHEVLEDAWKSAPEPEQALWRGLAQLAVGLTHAARGNAKGGRSLLTRGAGNIRPYATESPHGIDVTGLDQWAEGLAGGLGARDSAPDAGTVAPVLRG